MDLAAWQHVGPSLSRDQTRVSCIATWILYHWATREAWSCLYWRQLPHCLNYFSFMNLEIRSLRTFNFVLFFSFSNHSTHLLLHSCEDFFPVITVFVALPGAHPQPRIKLQGRKKSGSFLESVESEPCEKDDLEMAFHPSPGDTRMFFFKVLAILGPFEKFHINFTMRYSSSTKAKQKPTGILFRPVDQFELPRWH